MAAVFQRVIKVDLIEKVTFEQTLEGDVGVIHTDSRWKISTLTRRTGLYRSKADAKLVGPRNNSGRGKSWVIVKILPFSLREMGGIGEC